MIKLKRDFTVIELMIVVAIIAILFATIVPKFRTPKQINSNNIIKVMVTTSKSGHNTYKAIDKSGKVEYINERQFGELVSKGVEVIK